MLILSKATLTIGYHETATESLTEWLELLLRIRDVSGFNSDPETEYPEILRELKLYKHTLLEMIFLP